MLEIGDLAVSPPAAPSTGPDVTIGTHAILTDVLPAGTPFGRWRVLALDPADRSAVLWADRSVAGVGNVVGLGNDGSIRWTADVEIESWWPFGFLDSSVLAHVGGGSIGVFDVHARCRLPDIEFPLDDRFFGVPFVFGDFVAWQLQSDDRVVWCTTRVGDGTFAFVEVDLPDELVALDDETNRCFIARESKHAAFLLESKNHETRSAFVHRRGERISVVSSPLGASEVQLGVSSSDDSLAVSRTEIVRRRFEHGAWTCDRFAQDAIPMPTRWRRPQAYGSVVPDRFPVLAFDPQPRSSRAEDRTRWERLVIANLSDRASDRATFETLRFDRHPEDFVLLDERVLLVLSQGTPYLVALDAE